MPVAIAPNAATRIIVFFIGFHSLLLTGTREMKTRQSRFVWESCGIFRTLRPIQHSENTFIRKARAELPRQHANLSGPCHPRGMFAAHPPAPSDPRPAHPSLPVLSQWRG